jgi:hypothetical protein
VIDHANPAVFVLVFIAIAIVMHALAGRDVFTPVLPDLVSYISVFLHMLAIVQKKHMCMWSFSRGIFLFNYIANLVLEN